MAMLFFNTVWFWLAIVIITVIIEIFTVGLVSIWITGGAIVALILAGLGAPVVPQVLVFFIVTFVLLYFTRPLALKYFNRKNIKTNYEDIIGKEVRVIERVDNAAQTGKALYNGMEWTTRAAVEEDNFQIDEIAKVSDIQGVKLIIKKI